MPLQNEREWANHKWVSRKRNDAGKWIYDYGDGFPGAEGKLGLMVPKPHVHRHGRRVSDYRQAVPTPQGTNLIGAVAGVGGGLVQTHRLQKKSGNSGQANKGLVTSWPLNANKRQVARLSKSSGNSNNSGTYQMARLSKSSDNSGTYQMARLSKSSGNSGTYQMARLSKSSDDSGKYQMTRMPSQSKSKGTSIPGRARMVKVSSLPSSSSSAKSTIAKYRQLKVIDL